MNWTGKNPSYIIINVQTNSTRKHCYESALMTADHIFEMG